MQAASCSVATLVEFAHSDRQPIGFLPKVRASWVAAARSSECQLDSKKQAAGPWLHQMGRYYQVRCLWQLRCLWTGYSLVARTVGPRWKRSNHPADSRGPGESR